MSLLALEPRSVGVRRRGVPSCAVALLEPMGTPPVIDAVQRTGTAKVPCGRWSSAPSCRAPPRRCAPAPRSQPPVAPGGTIRMVGYQGVSSRPIIQRQSATTGSAVNTGRASAPARCVDRRVAGDDEIEAHHDRRGVEEEIGVGVRVGLERRDLVAEAALRRSAPRPVPFCSEISCTPGSAASGAKSASGMSRRWKCGLSEWPDAQLMPILNAVAEPARARLRRAPAPPRGRARRPARCPP